MDKLLKLYEFQKTDSELYALENAIKKSESRKKTQTAKTTLLDGKKTAQQYEDDIEAKKNEIETIISKYDGISAQVAEIDAKSASIENPEDAKTMRKIAEEMAAKLREVQSNIAGDMKAANEIKGKYHDLMIELQNAKQEYIENKEIHAKEVEDSQGKIDELKKQVKKLEEGLDKKLYDVYKKKRKNGMPVVVKVNAKERQCAGCFMELPLSVFENGGEGLCECENCGRILILE